HSNPRIKCVLISTGKGISYAESRPGCAENTKGESARASSLFCLSAPRSRYRANPGLKCVLISAGKGLSYAESRLGCPENTKGESARASSLFCLSSPRSRYRAARILQTKKSASHSRG